MWHFRELQPGFADENPRETEFFRIKSPEESLVREFIQNSLDARAGDAVVRVRIRTLTVDTGAAAAFLDGTLKRHLEACGMFPPDGLPGNIPCIVLEDFGTTGLDGPVSWHAVEGNFHSFWWGRGTSRKTGSKAGRWGLGKTTFHMASRLRTVFGLTTRNDGRTLLMGRVLARSHILDGTRYYHLGYWCTGGFEPLEDRRVIDGFRTLFGITREGEPGLSIVIPYPVEEIDPSVVERAVVQHYFYPVLTGMLLVEIADGEGLRTLDPHTLADIAASSDWSGTSWEDVNVGEVMGFIRRTPALETITLHTGNPENPEITADSFGGRLGEFSQLFLSGTPLRFRIPVRVVRRDGRKYDTEFTVSLRRFPGMRRAFECYIRSGILVSEIRMLGTRPVCGLLVATDDPVCEFLGDCETPAHSYWNERTEGFTEKYAGAARLLRFIKRSMLDIVSLLDEPPGGLVRGFWNRLFAVPVEPQTREDGERTLERTVIITGTLDAVEPAAGELTAVSTAGDRWRVIVIPETVIREGDTRLSIADLREGMYVKIVGRIAGERTVEARYIAVNPPDARFLINVTRNGFTVTGKSGVQPGTGIRITVAYDTRRRNPFRAYRESDFDLGSSEGPAITHHGTRSLEARRNVIEATVDDPSFSITVTGFDPRRDLVVDVREIERPAPEEEGEEEA